MANVDVELRTLCCIECGAASTRSARGWKAYLGGGYEGEPIEVGVFCPECAEREFAGP